MNKTLRTLIILVVLVLSMPLSARAAFMDILMEPATLIIKSSEKNLIFDENRADSYGIYSSLCIRVSANSGPKKLAAITWLHNHLPCGAFATVDSIAAGETKRYFTPFTEFGMVNYELEPGTMLLLGSCLLGLGLFSLKFRK